MKKFIILMTVVLCLMTALPAAEATPSARDIGATWTSIPSGWTTSADSITVTSTGPGTLSGSFPFDRWNVVEYVVFENSGAFLANVGTYYLDMGYNRLTVQTDLAGYTTAQYNGAAVLTNQITKGTAITFYGDGSTAFEHQGATGIWQSVDLGAHNITTWTNLPVSITNVDQTATSQRYSLEARYVDTPHLVLESSYYEMGGTGRTWINFSVEYDGADLQGGYIGFSATWLRYFYTIPTYLQEIESEIEASGGTFEEEVEAPAALRDAAIAPYWDGTNFTTTGDFEPASGWHKISYVITDAEDDCPYVDIALSATTFSGIAPIAVSMTYDAAGQLMGDSTVITISLYDQDRSLLDQLSGGSDIGGTLVDFQDDDGLGATVGNFTAGAVADRFLGLTSSQWGILGGGGLGIAGVLIVLRSRWGQGRGRI